MPKVGTPETCLIILRGNSGSGKSTAARLVRERYGRGIAIVGQDNLRRIVLRERDVPDGVNIGLIDLTARYALDHGYHVVLEGIFSSDNYGDMLRGLLHDHAGITRAFYFDVSFEETLRRHATKPEASEYGEPEMQRWYRQRDFVAGLDERCISEETSLDDTVAMIMRDAGLPRGADGTTSRTP
jgi:adenylate kinase family enzyme